MIKDNDSHFHEALLHWQELNLAPAFLQFARDVNPLSASMPLLPHNWEEIVELQIGALNKSNDEGLKAIFESVKVPYPTTSVHIGRKVGKLPELIELHNDTVRQLEEYLVRYLKGGKIGKKRPTIRIGGFMGMGGKKLDAIDYYS